MSGKWLQHQQSSLPIQTTLLILHQSLPFASLCLTVTDFLFPTENTETIQQTQLCSWPPRPTDVHRQPRSLLTPHSFLFNGLSHPHTTLTHRCDVFTTVSSRYNFINYLRTTVGTAFSDCHLLIKQGLFPWTHLNFCCVSKCFLASHVTWLIPFSLYLLLMFVLGKFNIGSFQF